MKTLTQLEREIDAYHAYARNSGYDALAKMYEAAANAVYAVTLYDADGAFNETRRAVRIARKVFHGLVGVDREPDAYGQYLAALTRAESK